MMEQDGDPAGNKSPEKKKALDLDSLSRPPVPVATSLGTLYLYHLRASDLSALSSLPDDESVARVRAFLPHIASLVEAKTFKDARTPLAPTDVDRLNDVEMEHVAEAYANLLLQEAVADNQEAAQPTRSGNEPAVAYLDRLLKHVAHRHAAWARTMNDRLLASSGSIFDQVRRSSSTLASTLGQYEKLTKNRPRVEIQTPSMDDAFREMAEHQARQARDRAEKLEMTRLTGRMTAESARTLKDLAEAATVLLEQLDERDKKSDRTTRKQITIAVWSVGVSAVIAVIALFFSGLAYYQDKANNSAESQWQSELITTVRDGNSQRDAAQKEAQRLRDQVAVLEAKVARIESAQTASLADKDGATVHSRQAPRPASPPR